MTSPNSSLGTRPTGPGASSSKLSPPPGPSRRSQIGGRRPERADSAIREVFVYRYRLIYRTTPDAVTVTAFIHGARDFERWRRES